MNGKTRDFCDARAILREKTRHSHKRDSANPVQMYAKVTSSSEHPVKMHTKNPTRSQIQGAVKAEGLQHKENPEPMPLPGKTRDFYDAHPFLNEKTRHSHKRLSEDTVKLR